MAEGLFAEELHGYESEGLSEHSRWDLEHDPQVLDDNVW